MATKLIQNGATAGAMMALMSNRGSPTSFTPSDYASKANVARAISDQVIVENALLTVPMADADNTEIGFLLMGVTAGCLEGRSDLVSTTAADYAGEAQQICAAAKQAVPKLV